jgi:hypothetical protein
MATKAQIEEQNRLLREEIQLLRGEQGSEIIFDGGNDISLFEKPLRLLEKDEILDVMRRFPSDVLFWSLWLEMRAWFKRLESCRNGASLIQSDDELRKENQFGKVRHSDLHIVLTEIQAIAAKAAGAVKRG